MTTDEETVADLASPGVDDGDEFAAPVEEEDLSARSLEAEDFGAPSPVLEPEPEPEAASPVPEAASPVLEAAFESKTDLSGRLEEMERASAEKKRQAIEAGQAELQRMRQEIDEKAAKKREAAREASLKLERTAAAAEAPLAERTMAESWSLVCDLIDFKRDTKADLSSYKSLLIKLKHV